MKRLWPQSVVAATALASVMAGEGVAELKRCRPSVVERKESHKRANTLHYHKKQLAHCRAALRSQARSRVGGQITKMWFIRVAFAPPGLSLRALSEFCRDFPEVESKAISHEYVSRIRDAFAEVVKGLNRQEIALAAGRSPKEPLLLAHLHDEAAMRLRSYKQQADDDGFRRCARGRSSKVQNNVVKAVFRDEERRLVSVGVG